MNTVPAINHPFLDSIPSFFLENRVVPSADSSQPHVPPESRSGDSQSPGIPEHMAMLSEIPLGFPPPLTVSFLRRLLSLLTTLSPGSALLPNSQSILDAVTQFMRSGDPNISQLTAELEEFRKVWGANFEGVDPAAGCAEESKEGEGEGEGEEGEEKKEEREENKHHERSEGEGEGEGEGEEGEEEEKEEKKEEREDNKQNKESEGEGEGEGEGEEDEEEEEREKEEKKEDGLGQPTSIPPSSIITDIRQLTPLVNTNVVQIHGNTIIQEKYSVDCCTVFDHPMTNVFTLPLFCLSIYMSIFLSIYLSGHIPNVSPFTYLLFSSLYSLLSFIPSVHSTFLNKA